MDVNLKKH